MCFLWAWGFGNVCIIIYCKNIWRTSTGKTLPELSKRNSHLKLPSRIKASSLNECLQWGQADTKAFMETNQCGVHDVHSPCFVFWDVGCCRTCKTYAVYHYSFDIWFKDLFHSHLGECLGTNSSHLGLWFSQIFMVPWSQGPGRRSSLFSASQLHPYHIGGLGKSKSRGWSTDRSVSSIRCFRRSSFSKEQRTWGF